MARGLGKAKILMGGLIVLTCGMIRLYTLPPNKPKLDANIYKTFSFIQPIGTEYCPDLFRKESKTLPKPEEYATVFDDFFKSFKALAPHETFRFIHPEEATVIYKLAQKNVVKQICLLGMHSGYEVLLMLVAKTTNKIVVFDSGKTSYTRAMAEYLEAKFSSRLEINFGDPESHIPVWSLGGGANCDMVVVRGGYDRRIHIREIRAIARASVNEAIAVIDNYPKRDDDNPVAKDDTYIDGAWQAWAALGRTDEYVARMTCAYTEQQLGQAFTVGLLTASDL